MSKLLLLVITLSLFACNSQQQQQLPKSEAVATVGDEIITIDFLNAFLQANGVVNADEAMLKKALDSLIQEVAMANVAKNKNLKMTKEQLNTLHYLQIKSMAENARQDYLLDKPITDEEILAEYNKAGKQTGDKEYRLHHVYYKDEIQAIKKREKITSVEDYKKLEQQFLQENPGVNKIGDIGWVALSQLPQGFRQKLATSSENTVLKEIIKTEFGAHIVYIEAIRDLQPPKLETVRAGVIKSLQAKKLSQFAQLARAKARVEIKK
jgi:peptidyl-prolyl cis-trans isomerase C